MPFTQMVELCQPYLELKNKENWELERFFSAANLCRFGKNWKQKGLSRPFRGFFFWLIGILATSCFFHCPSVFVCCSNISQCWLGASTYPCLRRWSTNVNHHLNIDMGKNITFFEMVFWWQSSNLDFVPWRITIKLLRPTIWENMFGTFSKHQRCKIQDEWINRPP